MWNRRLRGRSRNAFGVIIPPLHGSICNSVKTKWKSSGIGARRGHGVPSRYWSPLGVPEHFVGGWERLYKAFHGSWYIAVAFTCCFIRGHLDNISLSRKRARKNPRNPTVFSSPPPPLQPSSFSTLVGERASSRSSSTSVSSDVRNFSDFENSDRSRPVFRERFFFLFSRRSSVTVIPGRNDEEIVEGSIRRKKKER